MERHAVPQNIMDVEFKLFGALSVKQFGYLAGGLLIALSIYFLPFPSALRFVLIIIAVILGLFLSLVKINGQYSSIWLANFVVAMFTSQERVWKKTGYVSDVFNEEVKRSKDEALESVRKEGNIKASVSPLTKFETKIEPSQADRVEELRLKEIESQLFATDSSQMTTQNSLPEASNTQVVQGIPSVTARQNLSGLPPLPNTSVQEISPTEQIAIKGYVMQKDLQPVANALVSVNMEKGDFIKEAITDERGYFDLGIKLDPGVYFASISSPKLEFDYYKIKLKPNQDILYKFTAK